MTNGTLDHRLAAAHAANDRPALVGFYQEAAAQYPPGSQAHAFFLTHAYVFALECGDGRAAALRHALAELGAEPPLA